MRSEYCQVVLYKAKFSFRRQFIPNAGSPPSEHPTRYILTTQIMPVHVLEQSQCGSRRPLMPDPFTQQI